jgi:hypothetical protein
MTVSTSALYVLTRDKLRAPGVDSMFEEDAGAALRAWVGKAGRRCAVLFASSDRVMASLSWPEEVRDAAVWDLQRQCELFAIAWTPAAADASER